MCREVLGSSLEQFRREVELKRLAALEKVKRIPVAALIWGPAPYSGSMTSEARIRLKAALIDLGHVASFSEELYDASSPHSNLIQQAAQAEAYDIVFSIPDSPGSIAEIHDFARLPNVAPKIIAFLNSDWNDGYANRSLIELQSYSTCKVQLYEADNLPECIVNNAREIVFRLQELFYLNGRRSV